MGCLVWLRHDLRCQDNPALYESAQKSAILPIVILDPQETQGAASQLWLKHALKQLNADLQDRLLILQGDPLHVLKDCLQQHPDITSVAWNRAYTPYAIERDTAIKKQLKNGGIVVNTYNASLLWEPWTIKNASGDPYRVFTPYYKKGCLQAPAPRKPLPAPEKIQTIASKRQSVDLEAYFPHQAWYAPCIGHWKIGEAAAHAQLSTFMDEGLAHYKDGRNLPSKPYVSRLSPYLHFGHISPHQLWHALHELGWDQHIEHFCSELGWREFSYYLLYHFPNLPDRNFQPKFDAFPWQDNPAWLTRWQQGQTGIPIVDAGMRELWQTGYMHNRVRMIVASFLVKHLNIHWHHGAAWFNDCLFDADLASNSASWQWVAGCGADAAPYFRVFNPILQAEKFDPEASYIHQFVPELSQLPAKASFAPWLASDDVLKKGHVILGKNYPRPIVDLKTARERALAHFKSLS